LVAAVASAAVLATACAGGGTAVSLSASAVARMNAGAASARPAASAAPAASASRVRSAAQAAVAGPGTTVPGAPNCPMFPADNIWNTDISKLPVDPHSAAWLRSMNASTTLLHPDFGPNPGGYPYGIPYAIVTSAHKTVRVKFLYADQSNQVPYPLGPDTPIEGGKNAPAGTDRHALIVNKSTCMLYELWQAHYSAKGSTAGSGAVWNLRSNLLRPGGWTSADAAGLPILPGLLNFAQIQQAVRTGKPITHAIRFTAEVTRDAYIWPARHQAGSGASASLPPMGARFRLRASFNVPGFCRGSQPYCAYAKAVLVEMQHYGLILADNGSNWYFQGSAFPQWPDDLVSLLKGIPARDFVAVSTSCLMVSHGSGQARARPGCPIG
jgi:hypothetical protein